MEPSRQRWDTEVYNDVTTKIGREKKSIKNCIRLSCLLKFYQVLKRLYMDYSGKFRKILDEKWNELYKKVRLNV